MNRFDGRAGWAQRCIWMPGTAGTPALVDLWFMHLPSQAVGNAWDSFMLGMVHLRPMTGVQAPVIVHQYATHELSVMALAPGVSIADPLPWQFLTPHNVCVQFRVSNDDRARQVAEACAHACTRGVLMAETSIYMVAGPHKGKLMVIKEVLDVWEQTVRSTAQHLETGGHHGALN